MIHLKLPKIPKIPATLHLVVRQTLFLIIVGKLLFKIPVTWKEIIVTVIFTVILEHIFLYIKNKKISFFSFSSINTALSTIIMMASTNSLAYLVGIFIGLAQKHFIKIKGKHLFNPSNIAILVGLLLFYKDSFVISTPLGGSSTWWIAVIIFITASILMRKLGLLIIPWSFYIFFAVFNFLFQTHNLGEIFITLTSGNFLLYAFFMLGDPQTKPKSKYFLLLFSLIIAFWANILPLIWGQKDINWFLALFIGEVFQPVFRILEDVSIIPERRDRIVSVLLCILFFTMAVFYASDLNFVKNTEASFKLTSIVNTPEFKKEDLKCSDTKAIKELFSADDKDLYKQKWSDTHIIERDLQPVKSNKQDKYIQLDNTVSNYLPHITSKEIGFEYMPYAGLTAGDINHDGFLDLVFSKINQKIRVLVNNHQSDFVDITGCVFEGEIPEDVEYVDLADFNNDSWLDLLVIYSQYKGEKKNTIYYFDPQKHKFYDSGNYFGKGKKMTGGVSVADLNNDKKLDYYVSFGLDWISESTDFRLHPFKDEFWLSKNNSWEEKFDTVFPKEMTRTTYAGMTNLFTDFNRDGYLDLLLGNDFADPSMTIIGTKTGFKLIDKNKIDYNVFASMSYIDVDLDNDGIFELYEVGTSNEPTIGRAANMLNKNTQKIKNSPLNDQLAIMYKEFVNFIHEKAIGKLECGRYTDYYVNSYCNILRLFLLAKWENNKSYCRQVESPGFKAQCNRDLQYFNREGLPNPFDIRFNAEEFPKKLKRNALLKYDKKTGKYQLIDGNNDAYYTQFTWNVYPYDVNNDGFQDIFIGNGFTIGSHDIKKLLINRSENGKIILKDEAKDWGVDLEDDTRGVIIADFFNTGSGDLVVNNFLTEPKYFGNQSGGDSVEVELRSRNSNYYALGSQLELHTDKGIQLREINQGGNWDTARPFLVHFGIGNDDKIQYLLIIWPDGHRQKIDNINVNKKYVIYE